MAKCASFKTWFNTVKMPCTSSQYPSTSPPSSLSLSSRPGNVPPGVSPEAFQWFQSVDTDHSGSITLKELKQALVNSNWTAFSEETCLMMISKSQAVVRPQLISKLFL